MQRSPSKHSKRLLGFVILGIASAAIALAVATALSIKPADRPLHDIASGAQSVRVTDRAARPLSFSYQDRWNSFDHTPLYDVPEFLKTAFIFSEDRDFYTHHGVDWQARLAALSQNLSHLRTVRGASTISEQVVRMINPRPRTVWSRWLEGFEAAQLEGTTGKADILEFYLNQIPYASNRRGVAQAARYYFDRDLTTLTKKEMLALTVLVRAPSGYDLYSQPQKIEAPTLRLAAAMRDAGVLDDKSYHAILDEKLAVRKPVLGVEARHFVRHVRLNASMGHVYRSTLDASLQTQVQDIIDARLETLHEKNVNNAAVLVADHQSGEILAWVVAGADKQKGHTPAAEIDTVVTPRQPGSALKPFVYALALEKGWSPATILDDSPLAEAVGHGLHNFRNYSNVYYGPVSLREALGNSLNIPALLAIRHVGTGPYLSLLQRIGFSSLSQSSDIYDEGLALGNGEVTLLEMAQAYAVLANKGVYRPFRFVLQQDAVPPETRVLNADTVSLIGNILSDPTARRMEFGAGSVLNLPIQTAAKTGTSTDYRDAWTMAYNDRYVVGIWMGNLDRTPMKGVTGSTGPALALRSIFSVLNKNRVTAPLYFSPRLVAHDVCIRPQNGPAPCPMRTEWFAPGTVPSDKPAASTAPAIELVRPTEGLQIAYDPRIPAQHQKFRFEVKGLTKDQQASWMLDGKPVAGTTPATALWPLQKGRHILTVTINGTDDARREFEPVSFLVK